MKIIIAILLTALTSSALAEQTCQRLFTRAEPKDYYELARLLDRSSSNLKAIQNKDNFHTETNPKLDIKKQELFKLHANNILSLLRSNQITLSEVINAKVFTAESFYGNGYANHSYVLRLNNNFYSFSLDGKTVVNLNSSQFSVTQNHITFLRLDKTYIMTIKNNGLSLYEVAHKDPSLLAEIITQTKDPNKIGFLMRYLPELTDILVTTDVTIKDLFDSNLLIGKIKETGKEVGYFIAANKQFYLTDTKGAIEKGNDKKWGTLEIIKPMGIIPNKEVTLIFNQKEFLITDGVIKIPANVEASNLLFSNHNSELSIAPAYQLRFSVKYEQAIHDLINKEIIEKFDHLDLQVAYSELMPNDPLLVMPTRSGDYIYFPREGGWKYLSSLNTEVYGSKLYLGTGNTLNIEQGAGFLSSKRIILRHSTNEELSIEAVLAAIYVGIGKRSLTENQINIIMDLAIQAPNLLSQLQQPLTIEIIKDIANQISTNKYFTKDEYLEITKTVFAITLNRIKESM